MSRAAKYPIRNLKVGQSVLIPWNEDDAGNVLKDQRTIDAAIRQEQRRFQKQFERRRTLAGLKVRRIS